MKKVFEFTGGSAEQNPYQEHLWKLQRAGARVRITVEELSAEEEKNDCPFIGECKNENDENCKCCNDDGHWYLYFLKGE